MATFGKMEDGWQVVEAPPVLAPAEVRWARLYKAYLRNVRLTIEAGWAGAYLRWWGQRGKRLTRA